MYVGVLHWFTGSEAAIGEWIKRHRTRKRKMFAGKTQWFIAKRKYLTTKRKYFTAKNVVFYISNNMDDYKRED